jgi:hypothetical protein
MSAASAPAPAAAPADALPELAGVYWRPRVSEATLRRSAQLWTLTTVAHTIPLVAVAAVLVVLNPITLPVSLILLAHAWIIPELYAARGANVLTPRRPAQTEPERVAVGFLGDLVEHDARELHRNTALVLERGALGEWLLGEAGAVLVTRRGRRVYCYCVKATDPDLPASDRIAHLLLALRADESGFATVANLAFSGARWRLGRRLKGPARQAITVAALAAKTRVQAGSSASLPAP